MVCHLICISLALRECKLLKIFIGHLIFGIICSSFVIFFYLDIHIFLIQFGALFIY